MRQAEQNEEVRAERRRHNTGGIALSRLNRIHKILKLIKLYLTIFMF